MLEQELFQEEPQNNGVHATFGGANGIPGERDELAVYLWRQARLAGVTHRHVPWKHRGISMTASPQQHASLGNEALLSGTERNVPTTLEIGITDSVSRGVLGAGNVMQHRV
jgi:hypothetical protein